MTQDPTLQPPSPDNKPQGPYGLESLAGNPICDECDIEMHPFGAREGDRNVSGYACAGCGWSFDTSTSRVSAGL